MLNGIPKCISPELLYVLDKMGHGDEIVISDGNFPGESIAKDNIVIRSDGTGVPELLEAILQLMPLDTYADCVFLMDKTESDRELEIPIWDEYRRILKDHTAQDVHFIERQAFYDVIEEHDSFLSIFYAQLISARIVFFFHTVLCFQIELQYTVVHRFLMRFSRQRLAFELQRLFRSVRITENADDILRCDIHGLTAVVQDRKFCPVGDLPVNTATGKRKCTGKDYIPHRYGCKGGVFRLTAAGQSPCGGQHQCPGAELEKCSAVDHSDAPPVSGPSGSVTQGRYPF